eukprot:scaffold217977_cov34-Attheya_sp.AAC.1
MISSFLDYSRYSRGPFGDDRLFHTEEDYFVGSETGRKVGDWVASYYNPGTKRYKSTYNTLSLN